MWHPVHGQTTPASAAHICRTFELQGPAPVEAGMRRSGWAGSAGGAGLSAEEMILKPGPVRIPDAAAGVAARVHRAVSLVVVKKTVLQGCSTPVDPGTADEASCRVDVGWVARLC